MPNIETVDELADHLADLLGIYQDKRCEFNEADYDHVNDCNCRVGWVPVMADRIRQAVANEAGLLGMASLL